MRTLKRLLTATLVASTMAQSCDKTPTNGGVHQEQRICRPGKQSGFPAALTFSVTTPPCPIPIRDRYQPVAFAGRLDAPKTSFSTTNPTTIVEVWDWYGPNYLGQSPGVWWYENPNNTSALYAEWASGSVYPATYRNPNDTIQFMDSVNIIQHHIANVIGSREAWQIMPGVITAQAQTVLGVASLNAGSSSTWRAKTDWDTSAYRFKWLLNGQPISGATHAQLTQAFNYAGMHSLKSIAIRADNTADTVTRSIGAVFEAEIAGPDDVGTQSWCNLYYQLQHLTGGTAPVSLLWEVSEGVTIKQNDGNAIYASMTEGLQWVQVKVTDAYGNIAYGGMYVWASANGLACPP